MALVLLPVHNFRAATTSKISRRALAPVGAGTRVPTGANALRLIYTRESYQLEEALATGVSAEAKDYQRDSYQNTG